MIVDGVMQKLQSLLERLPKEKKVDKAKCHWYFFQDDYYLVRIK